MPELTQAQKDLAALIDRIFADGKVEDSERAELRQFWTKQGMSVKQVREVVDAFVGRIWGEVMADHVVSREEKQKLWAIVNGLHLPEEAMPPGMWQVISGKK